MMLAVGEDNARESDAAFVLKAWRITANASSPLVPHDVVAPLMVALVDRYGFYRSRWDKAEVLVAFTAHKADSPQAMWRLPV
jgi:hypothetical protein